MRLVTFSDRRGGATRVGAIRGKAQHVVDIGATAQEFKTSLGFDSNDMVSLIAAGPRALSTVAELTAAANSDLPLESLHLAAPIPRPRKNIFCVGWNYLEHFEEGERARPHVQDMPTHPTFFTKAPTTANGPYDPIPLHAGITEKIDWEAELGVVIGKQGTNIPEAAAMDHIFGYMVINDVSAREIQRRHGQQWFKGKSLDGFCPMGPWIVTADELDDPTNLPISCRVNGVTKQSSNTSHMYFKIPTIISELSAGLTLEPGDIICSGTPAGVGHARTPPEFMKAGDILETEVGAVGLLRNRIGREQEM